MPARAAIDYLDLAREQTGQALALWDAADLGRIERCRARLEQAEADLRSAIGLLPNPASTADNSLAQRVMKLREDLTRMTRLVDGGSAFLRELSIRFCDPPPVYDAGGRPLAETGHLEGFAG
jgi:hypothetical protein